MDITIRKLLIGASKYGVGEENPALQHAYKLLRNVAETRPAVDSPDSFGQDLYVICAETALQYGFIDIAKQCLQMFHMKEPAENQFLCRGYLCQAQLLAPSDANNSEQLDKAVVYIIKAIQFAKNNPRYHFLVYNASVVYWQFCRPFLKFGYRQYLVRSLHQVVKALDDIDDKDYEWRAQLMIALIECHLDAHRQSDASQIAAAASTFIKAHVPDLYKTVFGLMVRYQLADSAKIQKDLKLSPQLSVFFRICKLKNFLNPPDDQIFIEDFSSLPVSEHNLPVTENTPNPVVQDITIETNEGLDFATEIQNILTLIGVPFKPSVTNLIEDGQRKFRTSSPSFSSKDEVDFDKREISSKSPSATKSRKGFRKSSPSISDNLLSGKERCNLLMEMSHLCLEQNFPDLAAECLLKMKNFSPMDAGFQLAHEFLECQLMVKSLGDKHEALLESVVETRIQAIKKCEDVLMNAIRLGDPNVIQAGCATQWNLCLPLLQPNLRDKVRRPLTMVARALENIDSLLIQLRCQVHTELAKCEEDYEQIEAATEHLKKALLLDDAGVYQEKLEISLKRLTLRSQLYKPPESPEDQALMIIEQAKSADSGTIRMKRSLLVKAGEALAPDSFLNVLDSENEAKAKEAMEEELSTLKTGLNQIGLLAGKAKQYYTYINKTEGHLKRVGDKNEKERARLWGDLAKLARKQEVWDVCRVACKYCLLYDDPKWQIVQPPATTKRMESPSVYKSESSKGEEPDPEKRLRSFSRSATPQYFPNNVKDQIRLMAEVSFIHGEALVQLLRSFNLELNDSPVYPEDTSKRPKGYIPKKPEEDPDWLEYCGWMKDMNNLATKSFLRGLSLGVVLNESWLVCSGAAYIWNYNTHILKQGRHEEIIPDLLAVLDALKKVKEKCDTELIVNICAAISTGLIKPWLPKTSKDLEKPELKLEPPDGQNTKGKPGKTSAIPQSSKAQKPLTTVNPESMPDLKKAIEICDFAIGLTNGADPKTVVPMYTRMPVLQLWVKAKQLAQQQIPKPVTTEDENKKENQALMSRVVTALEMLSLNRNGLMEFKDVPSIEDVMHMMTAIKWSEKFVELQLWTRLNYLAFEAGNLNQVAACTKRAKKCAGRIKKSDKHQQIVEQEMLCYCNLVLGQCLMENMKGKNSVRREAITEFVRSARYAQQAGNHTLVMTAARHFWNACLPLIGQPIERQLLKEPLKTILEAIAATSDKKIKMESSTEEDKDENQEADNKNETIGDSKDTPAPEKKEPGEGTGKKRGSKETEKVQKEVEEKKSEPEKPVDDLSLRAAMYGVLFQSFADKGEWVQAIEAIDQAVACMPRTKHRLLLFKHRVMVKAKLGQNVTMDMQKFKDEPEEFVSSMWRKIALNSKKTSEQLSAYQKAIEVLKFESSEYQKIELLLEFSQWLYCNHFSINDAEEILEWAVDILLNMKAPEDPKEKEEITIIAPEVPVIRKRTLSESRASMSRDRSPSASKGLLRKESLKRQNSISASKLKKDSISPFTSSSKAQTPNKELPTKSAITFVPVVKKSSEIGVLPSYNELTLKDLGLVRQLEALMRAHVLHAEMLGPSSENYNDVLLMAHGFLMRLWEVVIRLCGPSIKEIIKNSAAKQKDDPKSANKKEKETKPKPEKEKPKRKRKIPLDELPSDMESWSTYDWPEEGLEVFKLDSLKSVSISEQTIPKPALTFHYTESLINQLREVGYNHLALPVLAFQDLLTRTLIPKAALNKLVHLRSLEICQELDLKAGVSFNLKLVGNLHISEEDQALSRNQISQWQDVQKQVAKEEQKIKEALEKRYSKIPKSKPITPDIVAQGDGSAESHLGKVLGDVSLQDIWKDTADILIRQGFYQRAREYLNEANIAAEAYSDKNLQAKILLLLAKLSFYEAQYGQTVVLCTKAQELKFGEESFWYEVTKLLAKATLMDKANPNSASKTKKILAHAIKEFKKYSSVNPSREKIIRLYCAKLELRLLGIYINNLLSKLESDSSSHVLELILAGCEHYEAIADLVSELGHFRYAANINLKRAQLLKHLALHSSDTELCKIYFTQAYNVLHQSAKLIENVFVNVHTLYPVSEIKNVNTPIQRELANVNMEIADVLTEILLLNENEVRVRQMENAKKMSITLLIEDYIRQTPVFEESQAEWNNLCKTGGDEALSLLQSAQSLSSSIPRLKARCQVAIGKLLYVVGQQHAPDPPATWIVHDIEIMRMQLAVEEAEVAAAIADDGEDEDEHSSSSQSNVLKTNSNIEIDEKTQQRANKCQEDIIKKKEQHESSKYFLMCASEFLAHGLALSLQHQFLDLASIASYEMVQMCGQYDPPTGSMMLALHQSCEVSMVLESLLFESQPDPSTSKLAALIHQKKHLLKNDLRTNMSTSSILTELKNTLKTDWQAGKKLEVSPNYTDLLKDFPGNYNFIVLQHSPDKKFLYGSVLDKPKGPVLATGKSKDKSNVSRARLFGSSTQYSALQDILAQLNVYRQQQQSLLLKKEYQRSQVALREKMLENVEEDQKISLKAPLDYKEEEKNLDNMFQEIIKAMNQYLKKVLEPVCNSLRSPNVLSTNNFNPLDPPAKDKSSVKDPSAQNECIVLLVDPDLMQLPLEACSYLQLVENVSSISRDFSIQVLRKRNQEEKNDDLKDGKKKAAKESSTAVSRIVGLKDVKQKQAKIVPLNRQVQPWQAEVNTNFFRYIVDPFLDCSELESNKPVEVFNTLMQTYEQQFTSRWLGIPGTDHTPSVGEWEIYMCDSSAFIFYGLQRFLSYLPPNKLPALNIPDCGILFTFDLAETAKSFQRQSKLDILKTPVSLSLEAPVELAMLATLAGVKCIIGNQWHTTLEDNSGKIEKTMEYLLKRGYTSGQALFYLQNPEIREAMDREEKLLSEIPAKPADEKVRRKSIVSNLSTDDKPRRKSNASNQSDDNPRGKSIALNLLSETPAQDKRKQSVGSSKESRGNSAEVKNQKTTQKTAFNTVCYGMPNLLITQ
ncbi:cilia- and flagella-associated protein 46-like isoform X4 [Physella acuta]|uniref:cilia- and flagella-associated protein 46-like isoform X4 n=1 Tax=Physella acuta TaxID=109671 RepID=UPI0027DE72DB|nr:cilia- and flagella-associated protein 46-like isoform X4 [Physella acuta]